MWTDGEVFRSYGAQKADLKGVDFFFLLLLFSLPMLSPMQAAQSLTPSPVMTPTKSAHIDKTTAFLAPNLFQFLKC